jgi:uncharacterized repeat protein (TIGR01451 family)
VGGPTYTSPPVGPYKLNKDLRDLPRAMPGSGEYRQRGGGAAPVAPRGPHGPDPLRQASPQVGLTVTPTEFSVANPNFDGFITGGSPPDTNGAPGPNHYIQTVNGSVFRIYDKSGNLLVGTTNFQALWAAAGAPADDDCLVRGRGDPYVVYDHLADRWVLSQLANHLTDTNDPLGVECLAVSQGPNPVTDGWFVYTFQLGVSNDYPKIGVWPDGYYSVTQQGYNGNPVDATVYDRATMLNGGFATFQRKSIGGPPTIIFLPADLSGPSPAPGTPNFYARPVDGDLFGGADRIEIFEFHVDWGVPANTTFALVQTLNPAGFSSDICNGANLFSNCIDQPADAAKKESLPVWPMGPLHYRNFGGYEALVFNHTVDVNGNGQAGVRWYELRRAGGVWSIQQQGTYSPPDGQNIHRWMGSVAMDKMGNMALGYSVSNDGVASTVHPGIRYAGRLATDPPGLLPFGEITLVDGGGSTSGTRWGDYSAIRVDPVDDCTFWYTTQYIAAGPQQRTRIGAFRFPSCNAADLAITKTDAPDPVVAGQDLTYTIHVTNNGPADATNVVVTDTLPAGTTYLTSSIVCTGGAVRTCNLGDLANGASTSFTITVKVAANLLSSIPAGTTNITNTASVAATELDPDTSNNTASASTLVTESADLRLTKTCKPDVAPGAPANAGDPAFCDIRVDNLGPSDAQNVVVTDNIVSNAPFIVSAVIGAVCVPATPIGPTTNTTLTCNLGTLAAGTGITIHVVFTSVSGGDVNDTATVTSSTPDPNTANNSATGRVSFGGLADLGITKTAAPNPVVAGTNVTYTLRVTNAGPSAATNVVVKDTIPAEVAVLTVTPSTGSCTAGFPGNPLQPLTCTIDSMIAGGSAMIVVVVKVNSNVPDGTVINNNATVASATADTNNANNSATAAVTVNARADLAIVKTSDAAQYKPSSIVTYTVSVTNNGPSDALAVIVTDNLPTTQQAIYQSDTGGCTKSALVLTCNLGNMPVGTSKSFNIYELVHGSRGAVSNTASVASATTDPVPGNNASTLIVTIGK